MEKLIEIVSAHVTAEDKAQFAALAAFEGMDTSMKLRQLMKDYLAEKRSQLEVLERVFGHAKPV